MSWDDWTNRKHKQLRLELNDSDDLAPARGIAIATIISVLIYLAMFFGVRG